jgi:hypothetical protein
MMARDDSKPQQAPTIRSNDTTVFPFECGAVPPLLFLVFCFSSSFRNEGKNKMKKKQKRRNRRSPKEKQDFEESQELRWRMPPSAFDI